jgi:hypothetical protein
MRSLVELAGRNVIWKVDMGAGIPDSASRHYVAFDGDEPVVEAQVMWQRLAYFDAIMESGAGTFHAHMDLTNPARQSVAWKAGVDGSIAGFTAQPEKMATLKALGIEVPVFTCTGWIATASGRRLALAPTLDIGAEYVIYEPGGPRLVTMMATAGASIGGSLARAMISPETLAHAASAGVDVDTPPGRMIISPEGAANSELGGLVVLAFALANEQVLMLHHEQPVNEARRLRSLGS